MNVDINGITIGKRFRQDLGNISSLVESIREVGLLHPVVVDDDFNLIAGLRRLEACKKLNWVEVPVNVVPLKDIVKGELHENFSRKDFMVSELVAIKRATEPELSIGQGKRTDLTCEESAQVPKGSKSRNIVAKFVGVSHDTLRKAEELVEAAKKEPEKYRSILDKVESKTTSLNYGYQMLKRKKAEEERVNTPLPEGEFDVIYADPPWNYDFQLRGGTDGHYAVMSIEELSALKIPSAKDAVLFLWATNPMLEDGLTVMKSWGFQYKTNIVWVKNRFGIGYYVRGQHELLLIGKKGNISTPLEENRPSSIIQAKIGKHSDKPQEAYELIEKMYPNRQPYLELFARHRREYWVSWGSELE